VLVGLNIPSEKSRALPFGRPDSVFTLALVAIRGDGCGIFPDR